MRACDNGVGKQSAQRTAPWAIKVTLRGWVGQDSRGAAKEGDCDERINSRPQNSALHLAGHIKELEGRHKTKGGVGWQGD